MKKWGCVLIIISLLLLTCSCDNNGGVPISNTIKRIEQEYQTEKISDYDSPYTAMYQNDDQTYDLYIFASPVQYKNEEGEYEPIDNRLIRSQREGYAYENKANEIRMFFPETLQQPFVMEKGEQSIQFRCDSTDGVQSAKKCTFLNLYGDNVEAIAYQSDIFTMYFYPTNLGIRMEIKANQGNPIPPQQLFVKYTAQDPFIAESEGYIGLCDSSEYIGVVYASLCQKENSTEFIPNELAIQSGDFSEEPVLTYQVGDSQAASADLSVEFYANKMPDSTAYSNESYYPYLSNYYILNDSEKGTANHYLRMRLNYFITTSESNILNAEYHIKPLSDLSSAEVIQMNEVESQWSSTRLMWSNKGEVGAYIANASQNKYGEIVFIATDFVKSCINDPTWIKESYGCVITGGQNSVLASSDNSLYPPYIKVVLNKEPAFFEPKSNINDTEF